MSSSDGAVSSGADKNLYRVTDMVKFIKKHIGRTPLSGTKASDFTGKKGIIIFSDCQWSNATGHVDLFNGTKVESKKGNDYFAPCNAETLYTMK
ncbi:T6SS effector amidase Tae4 family protein [Hallella multisaccharivorax]|uniref:T6SS effector amidase Tae4 family protein n=1 Tax=Hallella multisaccharivorax TaxID=310514 RepID=UPI001FD15D89|nr:T6SS effector amidase Tae4 family protein [Hallella multisaccharivorax]